jgi:hypothetical protein
MRIGFVVAVGLTLGCNAEEAPGDGDADGGATEGVTETESSASTMATASTSGTSTGTASGTQGTTFATMTATDSTSTTTTTTTTDGEESGSASSGEVADCDTLGLEGLLLYSTLDDAAAVSSPMVGAGAGEVSTSPADDFVAAVYDDGVRLDDSAEYVRFPQSSGGTPNIDFSRGTLEFCYRPDYDHLDSLDHAIFDSGSNFGSGGMRIRKAAGSNGNAFQVIVMPAGGPPVNEFNGPSNTYAFVPGEWHRVTVSWDFAVAVGEPNIRVWIDGAELVDPSVPTGPLTAVAPDPAAYVWVGALEGGMWSADGVIDDFRVYDSALEP